MQHATTKGNVINLIPGGCYGQRLHHTFINRRVVDTNKLKNQLKRPEYMDFFCSKIGWIPHFTALDNTPRFMCGLLKQRRGCIQQ